MPDDAEALQQIRANAELVVEQSKGLSDLENFGYDERSVKWLDGFIERQRARNDIGPEFIDKMVSVLGSYLGECIVHCYGGRWAKGDDGWRVEFDKKNAAYPFAKVEKQFANGSGDSVHSFFTLIPIIFRFQPPHGPRSHQTLQRTGAAGLFSWIRNLFRRGSGR